MSWGFLVGLMIGIVLTALIAIPTIWIVAVRTYRCVPCAGGRPVSLVD